jgi:ribosomal protein L37AE/L43A
MEDMFYCRACGKHKKVAVQASVHRCTTCDAQTKKYAANQTKRLRVSRHSGKQYLNERKLTETIKFLTKDD